MVGDPLRVAVLTSRRAPGLDELLRRSRRGGARYRIVGVIASEPGGEGLAAARRRDVPARLHPVASFTRRRGGRRSDLALRPAYDRATLELLAPLRPDALMFCGYLLIASEPLLGAYPGRILNVHDADLRLRDDRGGPRYPGLRATLDALRAGEPETRSTVHLVTETVDGGLPLAVSRPYPVPAEAESARRRGDRSGLRACAYRQREWMMDDCWGPLMDRGLRTLAAWMRCRATAGRASTEVESVRAAAGMP